MPQISAKIESKLSAEEQEQKVAAFLKELGLRLKQKRKAQNISQLDPSDHIGKDDSSCSKYESGKTDIPASKLLLYSIYCKFRIHELFPIDESKRLYDTFDTAVRIISSRECRRKEKTITIVDKTLTARIYEVDGKEVREEIKHKEKIRKEKYRSAEIPTQTDPFTKEEFCDYIDQFDEETKESIIKGGAFLEKIENMPKKTTLTDNIADYIVDETVVNRASVNHPDDAAKRAYAYYKQLKEHIDKFGTDGSHNRDKQGL